MMSSSYRKVIKNRDCKCNFDGNISKFVVSAVPADGLAPLGARPSAGTVMSKYGSRYKQE